MRLSKNLETWMLVFQYSITVILTKKFYKQFDFFKEIFNFIKCLQNIKIQAKYFCRVYIFTTFLKNCIPNQKKIN